MIVNVAYLVLTALVAGVGGYFGAYWKQKGKNLATHEDIDKLVDQVAAVTQTTKEIEAKISNEMWDRQKRWELKRDVLFQATKRLADAEDALLSIDSVLQVETRENKDGDLNWPQVKHERLVKWSNASSALDETKLFVGMVCDGETYEAFAEFNQLMGAVAVGITKDDANIYLKSRNEVLRKLLRVQETMRRELKIGG